MEEVQSKLVALMKDILGKKVLESSGKRRNEDDAQQNSKILRNE